MAQWVQFNVPMNLFINGDLKYFAQMLSQDGMSTSWCMYCKVHPKDWNDLVSIKVNELWSVTEQIKFVESINASHRKEANDKKSIESLPHIDFIEPQHYSFPQLHFEIGTDNNALDALKCFIEDEVEILSEVEFEARNTKIISDVVYARAREKLNHFDTTGGGIELKLFRIERVQINEALKSRNLSAAELESLQAQCKS